MTTIIAAIVSQRMSICWNHSCTVLNKFVSNTHIANCEETSFGMGDTYLIRTSDKFTLTLVWIVERSNPRNLRQVHIDASVDCRAFEPTEPQTSSH